MTVETLASPAAAQVDTRARGEWLALWTSAAYFFCLLCAYYVLRPVRDAMGATFGPSQLPMLYTGTFVALLLMTPLFGALVARFPRRVLLPVVYSLFIACLLGFHLAFRNDAIEGLKGPVFFIWLSVFNLTVVSVFWSFMSDIYTTAQARRFYGAIAAGGTLGAMSGPTLTALLARELGIANLMLVSALLLMICVLCILALIPWARERERAREGQDHEQPVGGSVLAGAKLVFAHPFLRMLALLMACGVAIGTLLYYQQNVFAHHSLGDVAARTRYFAGIDLAVNFTVLLLQLFVTRALLLRFGPAPLLLIPLGVLVLGLSLLAAMPQIVVLAAVQIAMRGGNFALLSPGRESLFTRVDREARYKAKNFIDTAIWRFGDMLMAWVCLGLATLGFGLRDMAFIGIALAATALFAAWRALRHYRGLPEPHRPPAPLAAPLRVGG